MAGRKKTATDSSTRPPEKIDPEMFYGLRLDDEQAIFANNIWSSDYDIVFCNAKAGTGKTTVATGVANLLVQYKFFKNIIYIMSPYGERRQGWLPGSIEQKSNVYFEPFFQALAVCGINPYIAVIGDMTSQKSGEAYIICITDTFLRGQNLNDAVVIIDEAQNCTVSQLKTILTRVGEKTKVVVIGHTEQCDLDDDEKSGFERYVEHFEEEERASVCKLSTNHRSWISKHADKLND